MKKKNFILIISAAVLIILLIFVVFLGEKKLNINSKKIKELHASLGEIDINKCGGLITYSDKITIESDLDIENRLCRAYYSLEEKNITTKVSKDISKNESDIKICKIGENATLSTTDEKETECSYKIIESNSLKEAYLKIYGTQMSDVNNFYISDKEICQKEGEKYYCGNAENYKLSIIPETSIYRIINKAVQKINGDIIVYDYFLKISNNLCYPKNNNEENKECSQELAKVNLSNDNEIIALVKKYGAIYKHTFKEDKNKNHYWFKTELK